MAEPVRVDAPSLDDVVQFIARVVAERYESAKVPTNGAQLAELIRHQFPDFSYSNVGLMKLAEAVEIAEERGLVARKRDVKHLEVLPHDAAPAAERPGVLSQSSPHYVRADIWRAFVYVSQGGPSFYDRQSGSITISSDVAAAGEEGRFVRIDAIPFDVQQEWMREFVRARPQLDINESPIHDQYCFVKFPLWLREHEPGLDRSWRQYRVQRVAECIREWANKNSIDVNAFFPGPLVTKSKRVVREPLVLTESAIRAAVIMAANELPIELLRDIAIPIRYVLRALQAR